MLLFGSVSCGEYGVAQDEARKLAATGKPLDSYKNNPLMRAEIQSPPFFHKNMRELHNDRDRRMDATHGHIYAAMADNMRYGGDE